MSSTASHSSNDQQPRFGVAEGLLRVLATKLPDVDLSGSDDALTFHMNAIANRLQLANLYDLSNKDPQTIEKLIRLMQFAEDLLDLTKNRPTTNKVLGLIEEIQTSKEKYANIIDVMILIAKRENEFQNMN